MEVQTRKHLVLQPLLILVTIAMVDFASLSVMNKAWAGDENDNVPLANGMPTEDLCVTCENRKNVIQGEGLIVGTNHEDFIQGSTHDILRNDHIFGKDMPDLIFGEQGMDSVYGGSGDDTVYGGPGKTRSLEKAVKTICMEVSTMTLL